MHNPRSHHSFRFTRRQILCGGAALAGASLTQVLGIVPALADEFADLGWQDLIPQGEGQAIERLSGDGYVQHGEIQLPTGYAQPLGSGVVEELNNKRIRIPGFMVPLVMTAEGVTSFILVPYMGACVHVPPPPPNQMVFVTSPTPWRDGTLFRAVRVTGYLETQTIDTDMARIGYVLDAEQIELFEGQYS